MKRNLITNEYWSKDADEAILFNKIVTSLNAWKEALPPQVRIDVNDVANSKMMVLCLIAYFVYYSAMINLRWFMAYLGITTILNTFYRSSFHS